MSSAAQNPRPSLRLLYLLHGTSGQPLAQPVHTQHPPIPRAPLKGHWPPVLPEGLLLSGSVTGKAGAEEGRGD